MVSCICIMVTCVAFATNANGKAANARCGLSISTRAQHTISNKLPFMKNMSPLPQRVPIQRISLSIAHPCAPVAVASAGQGTARGNPSLKQLDRRFAACKAKARAMTLRSKTRVLSMWRAAVFNMLCLRSQVQVSKSMPSRRAWPTMCLA